ncbi:MAG: Flp family type IVb pilin [Comamonadaceae bacterium]|nr:MAG: Flp family type IVb pilin [Comamonadaceae bacterium]
MNAVTRFIRDEEGATAIEYGIIAGLMSLALVTIFAPTGILRGALDAMFTRIAATMNTSA